MNIEVYTLNSFAKTQEGGNPAGVVLSFDFSEEQMLKIAKEVGFSETAFLNKIGENTYSIRFFTPCAEVDLCGHATIATFSLLKEKNMIVQGAYKLHTKAGEICITISQDNVFMTQTLPQFGEIIDKNEILKCFNISKDDMIENFPVQVISTGLRDIIVPVKKLDTLLNMVPNFEEISKISEKYNAIGIHAFSLETLRVATAHCRNFAPLYDIPEESATGTASGALSCYLFEHNVINQNDAKNIIFEQGYSMKKPSEIFASLDVQDDVISKVNVGGTAIVSGIKNIPL